MGKTYIFGAGGFAREVEATMVPEHIDVVFICADGEKPVNLGNRRVITDSQFNEWLILDPNFYPVCLLAVGSPDIKERIVQKYADRCLWPTLIHPSVVRGRRIRWGKGCLVMPHCTLTCDLYLGNFVTVNIHSFVAHDVVVEDYSTISPHVSLCGHVRVGKKTFIGVGADVLEGTCVGDDAIIGGGALVNKHVPRGDTVAGIPARSIKR